MMLKESLSLRPEVQSNEQSHIEMPLKQNDNLKQDEQETAFENS